jgi:hypothetical protein
MKLKPLQGIGARKRVLSYSTTPDSDGQSGTHEKDVFLISGASSRLGVFYHHFLCQHHSTKCHKIQNILR